MSQTKLLPAMLGLLLGIAISPATAFWRLPCTAPIVVERADPIVNPSQVSGHVHTIMGGNGFGFTMDYAQTQSSTCSSCTVKKDFSNYWVPQLYYQSQDGNFTSVGQVGGATVYYLQRGATNETLQAFPEGFRMFAGDPFKRSFGNDFPSQAISYACLDFSSSATPETNAFPTVNCPDGLRAQVFFPSCWDGVNLDSADHKSHMSYPVDSYNNGVCPDTHPVHFISLFYEVTWSADDFKDMWYGNSQPFVWAQGDPTGYGYHGDFVNGWDAELLQEAVDQCTNDSGNVEDCPVFDLTPDSQAEGCILPPEVDEQVKGNLAALPGCNPVQSGPAEAVSMTGCGATTAINAPAQFFTDLTSSMNWSYTGCGTDSINARILTGASESTNTMTVESCVEFCAGQGFTVAGLEYSSECYCGNSIPSSGAPIPGVVGNCMMTCSGNSAEYCGGSGTTSLYQKCTSSCTNAQFGSTATSGNSTVASSSTSSIMATVANQIDSTTFSAGAAATSFSAKFSASTTAVASNNVSSLYSTNGASQVLSGTSLASSAATVTPASMISSGPVTIMTTFVSNSSVASVFSSASASSTNAPEPDSPEAAAATATTVPSGAEAIPSSATSAGISPIFSGSVVSEATTFSVPSSVPTSASNVVLPPGWKYAGCYSDNLKPRSLKFWASFSGSSMSSTKCIAYCNTEGFVFGGTEDAGQCFCGNTLDDSVLEDESECSFACEGAIDEICGGPARLSVFTNLNGMDTTTARMMRRRRHLVRHRGRNQNTNFLF